MKNFFEKLRVEDWVVVWVSIPLLLLAALIPADLPSVPATLVGEVAWYNIGLLFAIVLVVLYVGCCGVPSRGCCRRWSWSSPFRCWRRSWPKSRPSPTTASSRFSSRCCSAW